VVTFALQGRDRRPVPVRAASVAKVDILLTFEASGALVDPSALSFTTGTQIRKHATGVYLVRSSDQAQIVASVSFGSAGARTIAASFGGVVESSVIEWA
jgi:hypothetical protein